MLKDSLVVVGADVYNRRNEKQKVYTVRRLEQIEGIWTVMDSEMTNALEKTRTELVVESTDYNVGLKEADFSRRELERRPAQGPSTGSGQAREPGPRRLDLPLAHSALDPHRRSAPWSQAPRANITEIDNDITAWFSKDDPVYQDYERLPRASSAALARSSSRSRPTPPIGSSRAPTLETIDAITGDIERVDTVQQVNSLATATIVDAIKSAAGDEGGLEVRPLLEDLATRDPADIRRRALEDDLIRGDLVSEDGSTTASSSASTRIASTRSAPASSSRSTTSSIPSCRAGVRAYYNGSLEISETYNRITLDNQRKFTPPILLFTVLAIYVSFRSWRKTDAGDVRGPHQRCCGRSACTR